MRLKRALKFGAIVGAENAAIEAGLVALDPLKNPNDIKTKIFKFLIYIYLLFLFLIPSCLGIKNISRIKRTGIKKVFNMFI